MPNYALADRDARPFHLGRVADLEPHAQLVGAVVEQKNGEDPVMNYGAHKLRRSIEQRLQVQRSVQRVC